MPVSDEYAARTPCRDHTLINTRRLAELESAHIYSQCEKGRRECRYSHTIFNVNRVHKLGSYGTLRSYVVRLHYGRGFARYGTCQQVDSGWEVTRDKSPSGTSIISAFLAMFPGTPVHNLPKALLLEESRRKLRKAGDPLTQYEKMQSLCQAHHERNACQRQDCKFDHDLVDSARIEKLARWMPCSRDDKRYYNALTVECRVVEGQTTWTITLKEAAFARLAATNPLARQIPPRPYSYTSAELLDVVRHMERVVGLASA